MSHPDELLPGYVDGPLAEGERAAVERHLQTCDRCRRDVMLAREGRAALRSLGPVTPPERIAATAIAESERIARERAPEVTALRRTAGTPGWVRWTAAVAAVAAVIGLGALVLPHVGGSGSGLRAAEPASERAPEPPAASAVDVQPEADYDTAAVQSLATSWSVSAGTTRNAYGAANPPIAAPVATDALGAARTRFGPAVACLGAAFDHPEGELVRVILARYQGTPAYLGVYLLSPGAGQPANAVRVLVVGTSDCATPLSSTQAQI